MLLASCLLEGAVTLLQMAAADGLLGPADGGVLPVALGHLHAHREDAEEQRRREGDRDGRPEAPREVVDGARDALGDRLAVVQHVACLNVRLWQGFSHGVHRLVRHDHAKRGWVALLKVGLLGRAVELLVEALLGHALLGLLLDLREHLVALVDQ